MRKPFEKKKAKAKPIEIIPSELKKAKKIHDEKVEECQEEITHHIMTMH